MNAIRKRIAGIDLGRLDAILALAIVLELELETWLDRGIPDSHRLGAAVAAALFAAPIAVRRRWPAGALIFCSAVALIQALPGGDIIASNGILLAPVVLAYSAGAWLDPRRSLVAMLVAASLFGGFVLLSEPHLSSVGEVVGNLAFSALLFATPWFVGRLARERSRRAAAFAELAVRAVAEHDERERAAVAQERVRIGSELQDIIAHSVSAMVIQAGGARRLLRSDPVRARNSILTVEQTGREALADLRRLLGMLRKDDDPRALAPQPGLEQLSRLVGEMRDTGLECELQYEGEPIALTPGVDLVGYRVIEAALHSAAQHRCSQATVIVRYGGASLELEIHGDGPMPDLERELEGMIERVALYDGTLRTLPGDTFALQARLPLSAPVPA
jgi:signal transduction histidine kinase